MPPDALEMLCSRALAWAEGRTGSGPNTRVQLGIVDTGLSIL